jgi:hypothetical protein
MAQTTQKTRVTCQTASSLVRYQHWVWRSRHRKHSLIYCFMLDYVYRAVAWQRVDQICYNTYCLFLINNFRTIQRNNYRKQLLLLLASAVRRESPPFFTDWNSRLPNLEGQVPAFISLRNRVAQLYPQALGSLSVASYDSQVFKPASTRRSAAQRQSQS